jgi:hypothetical protein
MKLVVAPIVGCAACSGMEVARTVDGDVVEFPAGIVEHRLGGVISSALRKQSFSKEPVARASLPNGVAT